VSVAGQMIEVRRHHKGFGLFLGRGKLLKEDE